MVDAGKAYIGIKPCGCVTFARCPVPETAATHDVQIMAWGLVYLTTCAPADTPANVLEAEADRQHPTGLEHGWRISADESFKSGQPNPCPCEQVDGRQHTLLEC